MRWINLSIEHHAISKFLHSIVILILPILLIGCGGGSLGTNSLAGNEPYNPDSWQNLTDEITIGMSRNEFDQALERFRANLPPEWYQSSKVKKRLWWQPPHHVLTVLANDSPQTIVIVSVRPLPDMSEFYAIFANDALQQFFVSTWALEPILLKAQESITP